MIFTRTLLLIFLIGLSAQAQDDDFIGDIINDEEEILLDQLGGERDGKKDEVIPKTQRTKKIGDGVKEDLPDFLPQENYERRAREQAPAPEDQPVKLRPLPKPREQRNAQPLDLDNFQDLELNSDVDGAPKEKPPVFIPPPTVIGEEAPAPAPTTAPTPTEKATTPPTRQVQEPPSAEPVEQPMQAAPPAPTIVDLPPAGDDGPPSDDFAPDEFSPEDSSPPFYTEDETVPFGIPPEDEFKEEEVEEDAVIAIPDQEDPGFYRREQPPREPPYVDDEINDLLISAQEAEVLGNTPSFIKLPFEETKEERLSRLRGDDYYKDLTRVSKTGVHQYNVDESEVSGAASVRVGPFPPPQLTNGFEFEDIYGGANNLMLVFDYEWKLFDSFQSLGLKAGIGFFSATGNGQFAGDSVNSGLDARETYTFLAVPVSGSAIYYLDFLDRQFLIPFAEAGVDAFGLLETRDDGSEPGYGVAPALHFAGGLGLDVGDISPSSVHAMDSRFGVNRVLLTIEARQFVGLNSDLDFTGLLLSGGMIVVF